MSLPTQYLTSAKNVSAIFAAIQKAGVPEKFSYEFLKQLGFSSSADRSSIGVMKALGFLDSNSVPTERYKNYRDSSIAGATMAAAVRDAYADLFTLNEKANELPAGDLKGMFARSTDKGDEVASKMATTFKAVAGLANFETPAPVEQVQDPPPEVNEPLSEPEHRGQLSLRHDVHVHLPTSTDVRVYEAIFRALREHLS